MDQTSPADSGAVREDLAGQFEVVTSQEFASLTFFGSPSEESHQELVVGISRGSFFPLWVFAKFHSVGREQGDRRFGRTF